MTDKTVNDKNLVLDGDFPRYILEPFEIVFSDDPRYESALTREQVLESGFIS